MMALKHRSSLPPLVVACLLVNLFIQSLKGDGANYFGSGVESSHTQCRYYFEDRSADCTSRGLEAIPRDLPEDIERLNMRDNNITSLLSTSFKRYAWITVLFLSRNDIRVIEPTAFYPLTKLTLLDINSCPHLVLPAVGFLKRSRKLLYLFLSSSHLKSLPNDTLKWSQHFEEVSLHDNQLAFINISSCWTVSKSIRFSGNNIRNLTEGAFNFVCKTETLDIRNNSIQLVDPNVIASLHVRSLIIGYDTLSYEVWRNIFIGVSRSKIEMLKIDKCHLSVFPRDFFDPLQGDALIVLTFRHSIDENALYPYVFSNLTKLHQLILIGNKVVTIEPNFFEGMQKLKVLDLNHNQVRDINPRNLTWKVDLVELDLTWNALRKISEFSFLGLGNLTHLDLSNNFRLSVVKFTPFSGLDNIQTIDLSYCHISRLQLYTPVLKSLFLKRIVYTKILEPGITFRNARNLMYLDMIGSFFPFDYLWDSTANISVFDGLFNLTILDMSANYYHYPTYLFPGTFKNLSRLQELGLDDCRISILHPLVFRGLESLQKLNLSGNNLQQLHFDLFRGLGRITNIKLDGNSLAYLDEVIFSNNPKLTNLSLANNKLTGFNQSTFKPIFSSLSWLDLSKNSIVCACDLEWFLKFLNGTINLINENQTFCSSASLVPLRGKPLLDFDPSERCRLNKAIFSLIPFVMICFFVSVWAVHHYRWQLRYKLFLLKLAVIGYREMRDARDHNDYEFDLTIIFYDDDEEWIREHLRPTLEERLPQFQRNVFGDEDLIPGMYYLEAVDYAVSKSYKTIIVLSRVAVRDRWFMQKFRTAMDHVNDTGTEFVVVVFLEDIPDDELPFLARLFLSDGRPYLHWIEELRGQEYFWKELVHNLTINLRTNDLIPNE